MLLQTVFVSENFSSHTSKMSENKLINFSSDYINEKWNESKIWSFKNLNDKEIYKFLSMKLFYNAEISIYKAIWKNYNIKVLYQDADLIFLTMQSKIIAINVISTININNHMSKTITKNNKIYNAEILIKGYNDLKIKELYCQIDFAIKKTIISCIIQIQRAWKIYNIHKKINAASFIQKKWRIHFLKKNLKKDLSSPISKCSQNIDNWIIHKK